MDDFRPRPNQPRGNQPNRPGRPGGEPRNLPGKPQTSSPKLIDLELPELPAKTPKRPKKGLWLLIGLVVLVVLLAGTGIVATQWYNNALTPVSTQDKRVRVHIEPGATPDQIAKTLADKNLIKSQLAFKILARQNGKLNAMQAGDYLFSPAQSAQEILDMLASGKVDSFNVTILPGKTLKGIKTALIRDGFSRQEVEAAFAKTYDHPIFADKPTGSTLEGYIFPDTYQINSQTTVEDLLVKTFDNFYAKVKADNLAIDLQARSFNLYQAITLASIVQQEVPGYADQQQVSQVFQKRLAENIELGSDVTFIYAAELTGQEPTVNLDSPYNTRVNKGLPPGPIANFNISALKAVANPAPGDYLYFVAGDDGTTHFSHTVSEHDANVKKYCTKLCN